MNIVSVEWAVFPHHMGVAFQLTDLALLGFVVDSLLWLLVTNVSLVCSVLSMTSTPQMQ